MALGGAIYIPKPLDHQVSKGNPSYQSLISLVEGGLLQDIPFYCSLRYPLRSGVPVLFPLFHYPFLSLILFLFPQSCVGTIGIGCDRAGLAILAIGRKR